MQSEVRREVRKWYLLCHGRDSRGCVYPSAQQMTPGASNTEHDEDGMEPAKELLPASMTVMLSIL